MRISILISSADNILKVFLDDENRTFTINSKHIQDVNLDEFASKVLRIISSWENEYKNTNVFDAEQFCVKVEKDGKEYNYKGFGSYPDNYIYLKSLIYGVGR